MASSSVDVKIFECEDSLLFRDARHVRETVFLIEQGIDPIEEWDSIDNHPGTWHCVVYVLESPVATGRIFIQDSEIHIGRIATIATHRHRGLASLVVRSLLECAREHLPPAPVVLGAQLSAIPFYKKLGFCQYGDVFLDANIEHIMMRLL